MKRRDCVIILVKHPHIQSQAALIQLKRYYHEMVYGKTPRYLLYLNWRLSVFNKIKELNEPIKCVYCGKEHLDPLGTGAATATLDHIVLTLHFLKKRCLQYEH
jgi:hypothetical protein